MISDTIEIDASEAIDQLKALADAASGAADRFAALQGKAASLDFSAAGPGKLAASWDKAAASISASIDKIAASQDRLSGLGAGAEGAAAKLGAVGDASKTAADGADALGASAGRAADGLKSLGASGTTAADGIKGLGDSVKASEAFLAEYNATMAETAAMQDRFAASSSATAATVARSQRLQTAAARDASADAVAAQKTQASAAKQAAADAAATQHRWNMAGLAGVAIAAYGIDKAAQLQAGVTRLYTTAGESKKNLPMISQGILKLAPETATSQAQLLQGAYMAESAGFHGQSALNVLKAGAEGAFAEGAPLGDTVNALTSLMNAYGMRGAKAPMSAMDQIIAMVSRGKMTMAGAVGALPSVLPTAAAAGLDFGQVGGALATMTATGTSPDRAAQHLAHTIGSLQNMSGVQTGEIQQLGGDPVKLEKNLGKTGLLGTLTDINKLVMGSMGKSGLVMMKTFNQSASAAADANRMLGALPDSVKGVAKAYADGSISAKQWNKEIFSGSESAQQKNLLQQFATVENKARGFSDLLKSGSPAAQTYEAALAKSLGGQTGLQTFLQLMGIHQPAAQSNTQAVTQAGKHPAADITGWDEVKKTLNFQLKSADQGLQSAATQIGKALLPLATSGLKDIGNVAKFFAQHPAVTKDLAEVGGGALALKFGKQFGTAIARDIGSIGKSLKIPGLDKLGNSGAGLDTAAAGLKGAAAALDEAAAKLSGVPGEPGGKSREEPGTPGVPSEEKPRTGVPPEEEPRPRMPTREAVSTGASGVLAAALFLDPILANTKSGPGGKNWLDNPFGMPGPNDPKSKNNWLTSFAPYERLFNTGPAPAPPAGMPAGQTPAQTARFGPGAAGGAVTPRVDTGKAKSDLTQFTSMLDQVMGKPVKMPQPDLSALTSAKGKAQQIGTGITQAIEQAMHKPVKANPPDLSAYQVAAGKAHSDGVAVSAGLANGILASGPQAVAAAHAVASQVEAAMAGALQTHSPSKKTEKIGSDTAAGLVVGLEGGQAAVTAAATAIGKSAAKAADITSIDSTVTKLLKQVPSGDTGLTKMLKGDESKLTALANRRSALEQQITDAQQISQQAISNANITGAGDYQSPLTAAGGPLAASATISGLQSMAADSKAFAQVVGQLKKEHLNSTSLNQITQAGPSALPMAQGLAQGGKQAIQQVNQLEGQIRGSAAKLGNIGAGPMYQAGIQVTQGLAQGIKAGLSSVDSAIRQLAQQVVNDVKKDLKSHSPAEVMIPPGMSIPQGVAAGIDRGTGSATAAMGRMSRSLQMAPYHPPAGYAHPAAGGSSGGGSSGGGGGSAPVHVHLNVAGSVMSEHDLIQTVQEGLLKLGDRNWQTGVIHPGRAG